MVKNWEKKKKKTMNFFSKPKQSQLRNIYHCQKVIDIISWPKFFINNYCEEEKKEKERKKETKQKKIPKLLWIGSLSFLVVFSKILNSSLEIFPVSDKPFDSYKESNRKKKMVF